jgi:uncharacterized protein YcbK (DUF882 family)
VALLVLTAAHGDADARKKERDKKSSKVKICTERTVKSGKKTKKKRTCRYEPEFSGHNAAKESLRTEPLERPSGEIWLRSENLQEELRLNIYAADGSYDESALAQLDEVFRCKRSSEIRAVDPRLYEQLSRIYDHFGKRRIELVSGFRFTSKSSSRHWHASAMDIRIADVTIREIYEYAESLDLGGMGIGIYPNSGFVHVDFRAPGEPSYRWIDRSRPEDDERASKKSRSKRRTAKARKTTS